MIELLSKFEFFQLLIFLLIIVTTLLIIIFWGKPYIRIGKTFVFGLGISNKDRKLPHINCPYKIDFKRTMTKTIETISKHDDIKYREVLNTQMSIVEEQLVIIRSKLLNTYSNLLIGHVKNHRNILFHEDYKSYATLVDLFLSRDIKTAMLSSFKQNNIADMSENDFKEYTQKKVNTLFDMGTLFFDNNYGNDKMEISREEIRNANNKIKTEYEQLIYKMFQGGQEAAITAKKKMNNELEKLYDFYEDIVGLHPNKEDTEKKQHRIPITTSK